MSKPSKLQPALIGGLILGLGSSIPVLNIGNYCCCLWAVIGGLIAARMLVKRSPVLPVTSGDGATAGLLAGLVGSAINLVIAVPIELLGWSASLENARQMSDQFQDVASRAVFSQMMNYLEDHPLGALLIFWLAFAFLGTGMAALSGVIGVSLFEKRRTQPPSPPPPAPPPPSEPPPQHPLPFDSGNQI
ncbi:MAG TPA: hypothetical protein VKM94_15860 [Blastocatellia bacterium]|nr:hypothetical protein [Blastocatellia bacterium]